MSIGTDIRVIVCRMMKTKEQDLLLPKWRRHIMLKNIQIMWTDRMKEIERQGTMTGRRSARYSYNFQSWECGQFLDLMSKDVRRKK